MDLRRFGMMRYAFIWCGLGFIGGFSEHGIEHLGSIKGGEFPDCLTNY
jgi:hypothetical protein